MRVLLVQTTTHEAIGAKQHGVASSAGEISASFFVGNKAQ
jgi:hypothetical protein